MTKKIYKILCAILTLGNHLWGYYPRFYIRLTGKKDKNPAIRCRICGKTPGNQWEIYKKKFKGKKGGKYVTNTNNNS